MDGTRPGPRRAARAEDVRRGNLAALLRYVHVRGATSRTVLSRALGLNRSTIGDLTAELVVAGLVREESAYAHRRSTGRPSYVVAPEFERVQVVAVDLGVTSLTAARVGVGGAVLERRSSRIRPGGSSPAMVVRTLEAVVHRLLRTLGREQVCLGVGVSVPGLVRSGDGLVRQGPNLGWTDVPLGERLAARVGLAVKVGNDADMGALAEHSRGVGIGHADMVYLAGRSGIGAGIFSGGRPLTGRQGYAGEVGHWVVDPFGRPCHCGSRGCWETEIGEERLLELAGMPPGRGIRGVQAVATAALHGDRRARAAVDEVAVALGRGVANVVNAFNPELIIMGGALSEVFRVAEARVMETLEAGALVPSRETVRLALPGLGDDSSLLGAAELAFAPLLEDPLGAMPGAVHEVEPAATG